MASATFGSRSTAEGRALRRGRGWDAESTVPVSGSGSSITTGRAATSSARPWLTRSAGQETGHGGVGGARQLDLRDMAAVELQVPRARQRLGHVAGERERDEPVAPAPHEQRLRVERAQARPEAGVAVRLLEVDVA